MRIKSLIATAYFLPLLGGVMSLPVKAEEKEESKSESQDSIVVWGEQKASEQAGYTSPISSLTQTDLKSINMASTEDSVKYEPSIVIRRRFIGDSNGTLGMRGSNMFQTSRSMVFADGVPLHYFLESRWNGAPRWTMVSSSEISQVDVVYGPFSAEYGGNAMGGVILIETKIPQQREVHLDGMLFTHQFDAYGYDESLNGYKGFASYGEKIGNLSLYASYNHLHNKSQAQSYRYNAISNSGAANDVSGGIVGNDAQAKQKMYYGDTGTVDSKTDNVKLKLGYDYGEWFALLNLVFEKREAQNSGNSYIRDANNNSVWSGSVTQDGRTFTIVPSSLSASLLQRNSLNTGLRVKGDIGNDTHMEINLSAFDVLIDETGTSAVNPQDPSFDGSGIVKDYDHTGWNTAAIKWDIDEIGVDGVNLVSGLRQEDYRLHINVYDSSNYDAASKNSLKDSSGGSTQLAAAFVQFNWAINHRWDSSFGIRYEAWRSDGGYYANDNLATPQLDIVHTPARSEKRFSPKFSLGLKPAKNWITRYAIAKAYRFPIVEELYSQYQAYTAKNLANPGLKPENGLHHNFMLERGLKRGYIRINLFQESIRDVIEAQASALNGGGSLRTFIPIDQVDTRGIEFIANIDSLFNHALDMRFNLAYTDSTIVANSADRSIEGNRFPRMPKWRSNLLATHHINSSWDLGGSLQYASNSFGRLDNSDTETDVYGAQDAYTFIGVKSAYQLNRHVRCSLGVDNITDQLAFVSHPWPRRTLYLNMSYDM